ncbi:sensor histidine kinase [Streptodolium elevatio]|uniref:histidine kinase n=1 Tax=Streptodolium elevatio TaxID=3157996 RepID=A0ABV3DLV9_9ACTN
MAALIAVLARTVPTRVVRTVERVRAAAAPLGHYPADAALAFLVLCTMVALLRIDASGMPSGTDHWYAYVLVALASVPLAWRRRWPFGTALVVSVAAVVYDRLPGLPSQHLQYGALIGVYTVADRGPDRVRKWVPVLCVAGLVASGLSVRDLIYGDMFPLLSLLTAYVLGCSARTRRMHAATLEARAEQLARERDLEADRAALRERERIAREMHDILGHAVSLMVVQAEAGPVVVRRDPARAEAAFDAIAEAGRDAMAQLRRLLGLLNRPGEPAGAGGVGAPADSGERAPQAGVDTLPELVARVRDAGLPVELAVSGTPRPLPGDVSLAVYRLVQESLTNTVRHAAATRAWVRIAWTGGGLEVVVDDDGVGAGSADRADTDGGGYGLVGLAHRVRAAGGSLTAGPGPDGRGFRVVGCFADVAAAPSDGDDVPGGLGSVGEPGDAGSQAGSGDRPAVRDSTGATGATGPTGPVGEGPAAYAKLTP